MWVSQHGALYPVVSLPWSHFIVLKPKSLNSFQKNLILTCESKGNLGSIHIDCCFQGTTVLLHVTFSLIICLWELAFHFSKSLLWWNTPVFLLCDKTVFSISHKNNGEKVIVLAATAWYKRSEVRHSQTFPWWETKNHCAVYEKNAEFCLFSYINEKASKYPFLR